MKSFKPPAMKGAIFYSTKYGSTAQYANWISEATGLPSFNIKDQNADPSKYDFLVLGSPIIYYKLPIHKWVKKNISLLKNKPIVFFSVSGAGAGDKLNGWIAKSLPEVITLKMKHIALRGRQNPKDLTFFDWLMLKIAGLKNPDPVARKDEMRGFDYMDKTSIRLILNHVRQFQLADVMA